MIARGEKDGGRGGGVAGDGERQPPPFYIACTTNDTVKVNKFINKHKVNERGRNRNFDGIAPLSIAAQRNHASVLPTATSCGTSEREPSAKAARRLRKCQQEEEEGQEAEEEERQERQERQVLLQGNRKQGVSQGFTRLSEAGTRRQASTRRPAGPSAAPARPPAPAPQTPGSPMPLRPASAPPPPSAA